MKKLVFILVCCIMMGSTYAQNKQFTELSEEAIKNIICSITAENYQFYGLSSVEAIKSLRAGEGIVHYAVGLSDLKEYNKEADPLKMIRNMGFVTVPLYSGEKNTIESFILLNKRDDNYEFTGMGAEPYSSQFLTYKNTKDEMQVIRLIRVPGLNKSYAGFDIDGVLHLVSLTASETKQSEPRPAAEVFEELAKQLGKNYDFPH